MRSHGASCHDRRRGRPQQLAVGRGQQAASNVCAAGAASGAPCSPPTASRRAAGGAGPLARTHARPPLASSPGVLARRRGRAAGGGGARLTARVRVARSLPPGGLQGCGAHPTQQQSSSIAPSLLPVTRPPAASAISISKQRPSAFLQRTCPRPARSPCERARPIPRIPLQPPRSTRAPATRGLGLRPADISTAIAKSTALRGAADTPSAIPPFLCATCEQGAAAAQRGWLPAKPGIPAAQPATSAAFRCAGSWAAAASSARPDRPSNAGRRGRGASVLCWRPCCCCCCCPLPGSCDAGGESAALCRRPSPC
jgi:hypothetical protein